MFKLPKSAAEANRAASAKMVTQGLADLPQGAALALIRDYIDAADMTADEANALYNIIADKQWEHVKP